MSSDEWVDDPGPADDGGGFRLPHDGELEIDVIRWAMQSPANVEQLSVNVPLEAFFDTEVQKVAMELYSRYRNGQDTSFGSMLDVVPSLLRPELIGGPQIVTTPATTFERLRRLLVRRRIMGVAASAYHHVADSQSWDENDLLDRLKADVAEIEAFEQLTVDPAQSWHEVAYRDVEQSAWLIDGMMRRRHRAILVAGEGVGKTFILRQIAMAAACGVHPFWPGHELANGPIRTLTIDLENPPDQVTDVARMLDQRIEKLGGLTLDLAEALVVERDTGINIRSHRDRSWVENILVKHRPDLLCIGPIYKMYSKRSSESDEEAAREVCEILDSWRARFDLALAMEHHAPHSSGKSKREMRPVGSSYWLRWPEFGRGLRRDSDVSHRYNLNRFRGDRVKVDWPSSLDRRPDQSLPWMGHWEDGATFLNAGAASAALGPEF